MLFSAKHITVVLAGDDGRFRAVDDVSLELAREEILDITGPSGSGKSTLLHAIGRQTVSFDGAMYLDGASFLSYTPQRWRQLVALVQQKPVLAEGSVQENLMLPWSLDAFEKIPMPTDADLLEALGSAHLEDIALDRSIDRLSVGQQARVAFLRTLLTDPEVLLLDEVDAALDDVSAQAIGELTSAFIKRGKGAIRVRHRADDGRATSRLIMRAGQFVDE
ncbi:MAG: ATP-binding cassette domain-containing protein [Coriobacteriia bacterium]|nr:ATP-binding cassette domain-containing protein [Coriobacteriia bacterium]